MFRPLLSVLTAVQLMLCGVTGPQLTLTTWFKTGEMLRFHVVAQDDTEEMQRVKLCVRDAVRACYREKAAKTGTMLDGARTLLPDLTQTAVACARREGFTGDVRVELGRFTFDERPLSTTSLPAGEYPALMIFLGDAKGHNWWGLLDPELALLLAKVPAQDAQADAPIQWDWSLRALLSALFGWPLIPGEEA